MSITLALTALGASNWKTIAKYAGIVLVAAGVIYAPYHYGCKKTAETYEAKIALMEKVHAQEKADALEWQLAAEHAASKAIEQEVENAKVEIEKHRAAVAAASAGTAKLRAQFNAYVAGHANGSQTAPAASGSSPSTEVLSDVFGRVAEAAGRFAEEADAAVIAGRACEKMYEAGRGAQGEEEGK